MTPILRNTLIVATVAMLTVGTSGCKRADNTSDAGSPGMSSSASTPAAAGTMAPAPSGPSVASGASQ